MNGDDIVLVLCLLSVCFWQQFEVLCHFIYVYRVLCHWVDAALK